MRDACGSNARSAHNGFVWCTSTSQDELLVKRYRDDVRYKCHDGHNPVASMCGKANYFSHKFAFLNISIIFQYFFA